MSRLPSGPCDGGRVRSRLLPLLLVPVLLSGCIQGSSEERAANDAQAERLSAQLAELPGVGTAEVRWLSDSGTVPTASVELVLDPGAQGRPVVDAATEAVWRTPFQPLDRISVEAYDPTRPGTGVSADYSLRDDADDLQRRFGPRAVRD